MSAENDGYYDDCSFVSIHYIICECGETFPSENGLKAHLEKEHPHKRERKEFKCGVCGSVFNTEEECITHYEDTHIEELKQEEYAETEDVKPDLSQADLSQADLSQADLSQADLSQADLSQAELSQSEVYMEETEEFQKLDYVSPEQYEENSPSQDSQSELIQDQEITFQEPEEEFNEVETQQCILPEQYVEVVQEIPEGQLVLVVKNASKKKDTKQTSPKKKNTKNLRNIVCEWCGKKYPSNAALRYHQRVHTGERPYHCHLCPKTFTMPLFLQIHIRVHTGERPFKCTDCPKAFSNKAALLRHERVHTGVKPYVCPMCFKAFTQSNSMKLHVATVHLKQPAPYKSKSRKLKEAERMSIKQDKPTAKANSKTVRVITTGKDGKSNPKPASIRPFAKRTGVRDVVVKRCDVIGRIDNNDENQRAIASLTAANGEDDDYKLTIIKLESPAEVDEVLESEVVDDHSDQERYEIVYDT